MSPRPRKASDEEVFAAALRVMGRVGPAELTLSAIASEAGVTASALVQRFGSKLTLLRTLSRQAAAGPGDPTAPFRAAHGSPLAALRAYARCFATLAPTPPALARSLAYLHQDLADRQLYPPLLRHARATRAGYEALIGDAVAAGELSVDADAPRLARLLDAVVCGALLTWAIHREGDAGGWISQDVEAALAPYLMSSRRAAPRPAAGTARSPGPRRPYTTRSSASPRR